MVKTISHDISIQHSPRFKPWAMLESWAMFKPWAMTESGFEPFQRFKQQMEIKTQ